MSDDEAAQRLTHLLQEREALDHRLAGIDVQLARLQEARAEELSRRLASLEDAVRRLTLWSGVAPHPEPTAEPASAPPAAAVPPPPTPLAAAQPASVTAVVPPAAPATPMPQPPAPQPRVIGERVAVDSLALWAGPGREAALLGWIPSGTRLLLTEEAADHRVLVVYRNRLAWADPNWLADSASPAAAPRGAAVAGPQAPERAAAPATAPPGSGQPAFARPGGQPVPASGAPSPRTPVAPVAPLPVIPATPPVWSRPGFMAKLLALVGAAVTLIGVAFLLVLAAQYGLFGPEARTISAAALAVALVALAFLVRRRDPRNVGAPILAATGVAAGFLSVVTATVIYGWLPPLVGAFLSAVIGLGGMWLARRWNNEWVALTSVLGSLVLAAYVGAAEPIPTAGLMVLMTAVTLWFERGTGWRLFPFGRVIPTVLTLLQLIVTSSGLDDQQRWWLVGLSVVLAFLGLASALIAPVEPSTEQGIALGLLVPMVFPVGLAPLLLSDTTAAALVLGVVALVYGVTGFLPMVHERVRWAAVPVGAAFALLAVFTFTHHRYLGVLTLALATVYLAVAARSRSTVNLIVGGLLGVVGLATWLPWLRAVFSQRLAQSAQPEQVLQSLAGIAVVVLAAFAAMRWAGEWLRWMIYLAWGLSITIGSVAFVIAGTWVGAQTGNAAAGFQSGHALVTVAWMVLCILFLRRGLAARKDEDIWLHLALAIAGLAVAKLFLMDLGTLDAIARVGAFLAVGLLLLFVGTRYARAWERAHGENDADTAQQAVPPAPSPQPAPVPQPSSALQPAPAPQPAAAHQPAPAPPSAPPLPEPLPSPGTPAEGPPRTEE